MIPSVVYNQARCGKVSTHHKCTVPIRKKGKAINNSHTCNNVGAFLLRNNWQQMNNALVIACALIFISSMSA